MKIHNIFYMSLFEQNITRKGQMDKKEQQLNGGSKDSEEYKVEAIQDSTVLISKLESNYLPKLDYLIF